jgi:hypothetical protein
MGVGVCQDNNGFLYVAGYTGSASVNGAGTNRGGYDGFVSKWVCQRSPAKPVGFLSAAPYVCVQVCVHACTWCALLACQICMHAIRVGASTPLMFGPMCVRMSQVRHERQSPMDPDVRQCLERLCCRGCVHVSHTDTHRIHDAPEDKWTQTDVGGISSDIAPFTDTACILTTAGQ